MDETERIKIEKELIHALGILREEVTESLIPREGLELVYASIKARSPDQVGYCRYFAGNGNDSVPPEVRFGTENGIVSSILTAMRFSPDIRSAGSLAYSAGLEKVCKEMFFEVCACESDTIPPGVSTMDWAVAFFSSQEEGVPDILIIRGNPEGSSGRIFGDNPVQVATNIIKISKRIIDATQ
ncbi:MAG: hypothetical protein LUQ07_06780 [Methanospirillum sp.]|nr:hypothetical protein [Methanospirillum sp.]